MIHPRRLLLRANAFFVAGMIMFTVAAGLRLEAHNLSVQSIHVPNTPGTELNATILDQEEYDALVELARAGLLLGGVTSALAVAAKLFVPAAYPPVVEILPRNV